jgi:hypothetical protein
VVSILNLVSSSESRRKIWVFESMNAPLSTLATGIMAPHVEVTACLQAQCLNRVLLSLAARGWEKMGSKAE